VALPKFRSWGDKVRWAMQENTPGSFPYTAGVFAFKREGRGTVQADILKEDQGQNTCIFSPSSPEGDGRHRSSTSCTTTCATSTACRSAATTSPRPAPTRSASSPSRCPTASPTWSTYLARGMHIDDFAPNLSFFFSNGMDPEYTVMGRVARRIWAVAMKHRYGANERSQKLKYHIQTSGRSLHAQEIDFNDIRTTLQALIAIYDNCNSLHTNAYDEAITTPTEESVRRAMAIQLIINREWGLAKNENPNQGAFIIDELTDLVEEAVLSEFERIAERGGVLGAMETGYQRGKIQEESMHYEMLKHTGEYPIIGVNTFLRKAYATESAAALKDLQHAAIRNENMFAVLMEACKYCSLGQLTDAMFEVGGQYPAEYVMKHGLLYHSRRVSRRGP
jgi:methylmalonyl-CoA mutase